MKKLLKFITDKGSILLALLIIILMIYFKLIDRNDKGKMIDEHPDKELKTLISE